MFGEVFRDAREAETAFAGETGDAVSDFSYVLTNVTDFHWRGSTIYYNYNMNQSTLISLDCIGSVFAWFYVVQKLDASVFEDR